MTAGAAKVVAHSDTMVRFASDGRYGVLLLLMLFVLACMKEVIFFESSLHTELMLWYIPASN